MSDWLPDRLPEDIEGERSLLATLGAPGAEGAAAEITARLSEEAFVHPGHRVVFRALRGLALRREEINALTLKAELEHAGELGRVGGYPGLVEMLAAEEVGRPASLERILIAKMKHRQLIRVGAQLVRAAADEEEAPELLVDRISASLAKLAQAAGDAGPESLEDLSNDAVLRLLDRIDGVRELGLKVGFSRFDALTQGFKPGNLIILAARPGVGKTALALNWALQVARGGGHVAFFSLEMSKAEVFDRLVAAEARVDLSACTNTRGYSADDAKARVLTATDLLRRLPLYLDDRSETTVAQITAKCDRLEARLGRPFDLVMVDYLQLLSSPADSRGAKQNEAVRIGEISRGLKLFAKDRGKPVVVLSQLNREVENRSDHKPRLADLRDSGSLEQDADMVAFVHRRILPGDEEKSAETELILAKHRNGRLDTIPMSYEGRYFTYRESERMTVPRLTSPGHSRRDAAFGEE